MKDPIVNSSSNDNSLSKVDFLEQEVPNIEAHSTQTASTYSDSTQSADSSSISANKKKTPWFACISAVVFLPILLCLAFLALLLSTAQGQHQVIQWTDSLVEELSIGQVEGSLQEGLALKQIKFQSSGIDIQLDRVMLQWELACLWKAQFCLHKLEVNQPVIQIETSKLPPSTETENNDSSSSFSLPIDIEAGTLKVSQLNLMIDQTHLSLAQFSSGLSLTHDNGLILQPTLIEKLRLSFYESKPKEQSPLESEDKPIDWHKIEQNLTQPFLSDLSKFRLPIPISIIDLQAKDWQIEERSEQNKQQIRLNLLHIQGRSTSELIQLDNLLIDGNIGKKGVVQLKTAGSVQLSDSFPIDLKLSAKFKDFDYFQTRLFPNSDLHLQLGGTLAKQTALFLETKGDIDTKIVGNLSLTQEKMPLHLQVESAKFQFPFEPNAEDPLILNDFAATIDGNLLDYRVTAQSKVKGMYSPTGRAELIGRGKIYQAEIDELHLFALTGYGLLKGSVDWRDGATWDAVADFSTVNLGLYFKHVPAVVTGLVHCSGEANSRRWQVNIPHIDLQGTWSQRPASLKGGMTLSQEQLFNIPDLQLIQGDNHISARGILADKSDFYLGVKAPNLNGLISSLRGSLNGHLNYSGDWDSPNLNVDLIAHQAKFGELELAKGVLKGEITSKTLTQGKLNLDINGLHYGQLKFSQGKILLAGDEKNHQLNVQSQGEPIALNMNLSGNFDRTLQRWKGEIHQVNLSSVLGQWRANQKIHVDYQHQTQTAQLSSHCWLNPDADLCFTKSISLGQQGHIPFEMKKFNLALINRLAKQELLKGQLKSSGLLTWTKETPVFANVNIQGNQLHLTQKLDYRTLQLDLTKMNFDGELKNNQLTLKSEFQLPQQGKINTEIKLQDLEKARTLSGRLQLEQLNLSLFNQLLAKDENVQGKINGNLTFSGNATAPLLHGSIQSHDIKTKIKPMPFDINGGELNLKFNGSQSKLTGFVQTEDSRLNLQGEANWQNLQHWHTVLSAKAEQFKINIPSMAKLKISPNVEFKANPHHLELTGDIDIPWARIEVDSLPESAVTVSKDEVILDGKTKKKYKLTEGQFAAKTKSGMEIRSNLKINIGNDVTLEAYGLNSHLEGKLAIQQEKGKLGLFGQINLKNGRYASFGQDLLIRKGSINFTGLMTQPMLDIEAIRNPTAMEDSNMTAGVKVVGFAESPEVTVFTTPSTSQDQALSYLLTGRSLENSSEAGSGGSIGAALLGMGLAKSGKVVGGIGKAFGIQDLNLGTQGVGDNSKVVVSGNITPRLQVKYGVGLFDGLAELTVRYKLLPQLYLQSVSGVNQAIDLLYQIEF